MVTVLIAIGIKLTNYRIPVTRERFVNFMIDNGYYVASNFIYTSGEDYLSGDNDGLLINITAEIDELNIKVDYFDYVDDIAAHKSFLNTCQEIEDKYFFAKSRQELLTYFPKKDYIKESYGENYSRYIIRNPDGHNVTSIVSQIDNTLIVVRDTQDNSYYKIRDSLGNIGY